MDHQRFDEAVRLLGAGASRRRVLRGLAAGLLGLGALINVCATLPANFVAFEYPSASDPWWPEIVTGLPEGRLVVDSMMDLLPGPGLGLDIDPVAAKPYLRPEDASFFD